MAPISCHCATPVKTHYINPGPRLGLAYRLGEKTVIRAGFSLVYAHAGGVGGRVNGRQGLSQLGFNTSASFSSVATGQPAFNWASGYPPFQPAPFINPSYGIGFITAAAGAPIAGPSTAQTITFGDPDLGGKPPYYENWNLNIQHSITPSLTLSVAYSGSSGHFLPGAGNLGPMTNQIPLQYITLGPLLGQTLSADDAGAGPGRLPQHRHPLPEFHGDDRPGAEAVPAIQRHRQSVGEPGNLHLQRPADHAHPALHRKASPSRWPTPSASNWTIWSARRAIRTTTRSKRGRA